MAEGRTGVTHTIEELRNRIDLLDETLVRLLNARAACAMEIGRLKRERSIPVYQPQREAEVLQNVQRLNNGPLDQQAMRRLFERIIDEARHLERVADDKEGGSSGQPR
jgi:chorismate mutase